MACQLLERPLEEIGLFYAWQTDRPNRLYHGFIRRALETAASELSRNFQINDAQRSVAIRVDSDTLGVRGSAAIAETIFEELRCTVST